MKKRPRCEFRVALSGLVMLEDGVEVERIPWLDRERVGRYLLDFRPRCARGRLQWSGLTDAQTRAILRLQDRATRRALADGTLAVDLPCPAPRLSLWGGVLGVILAIGLVVCFAVNPPTGPDTGWFLDPRLAEVVPRHLHAVQVGLLALTCMVMLLVSLPLGLMVLPYGWYNSGRNPVVVLRLEADGLIVGRADGTRERLPWRRLKSISGNRVLAFESGDGAPRRVALPLSAWPQAATILGAVEALRKSPADRTRRDRRFSRRFFIGLLVLVALCEALVAFVRTQLEIAVPSGFVLGGSLLPIGVVLWDARRQRRRARSRRSRRAAFPPQ